MTPRTQLPICRGRLTWYCLGGLSQDEDGAYRCVHNIGGIGGTCYCNRKRLLKYNPLNSFSNKLLVKLLCNKEGFLEWCKKEGYI